jgi:hypothetical protein
MQDVLFTTEEKASMMPISDIKKARVARDLWQRIGPVSKEQVKIIALKSNTEVSPRDIENSIRIYGPHAGVAAGKSTEPSSVVDRGTRVMAMPNQRVTMFSDIMWIRESAFLVSRFEPIGLANVIFYW